MGRGDVGAGAVACTVPVEVHVARSGGGAERGGCVALACSGEGSGCDTVLGGARAWAPAPARIHSGAGSLRCVRAVRCVRSPFVTRPCCLSDSLLCLCLCVFISLLLLLLLLLRAGTVAMSGRSYLQSAVCAEHPMVAGVHYMEMTLLEQGGMRSSGDWTFRRQSGPSSMGVVGQGFDAAGGGCASSSAKGWVLSTKGGTLWHARCDLWHAGNASNWQGMPQYGEIKQGDVVGLLLDLGQRTLSVYVNGARRGVMVAPGMKDMDGEAVAPLVGPLRWAVEVGQGASVPGYRKYSGASVRIERRPAPGPVPSAEEVAAAVAWNDANYEEE
eukprot:COSAG06_NODE_7634_length_2429_cov_10.121732_2_plen_329_part_00